jgi:hypothetical protein
MVCGFINKQKFAAAELEAIPCQIMTMLVVVT